MFNYRIIESNRKSICLQISEKGELIVRAPHGFSREKINDFVIEQKLWIERNISKQLERQNTKLILSNEEINDLKKLAFTRIKERVDYYAPLMKVKPTGVKITSAQKRFGSCNSKNSLCFSYILMLYPEEAIDYVVVHELAHIRHHDHSIKFYKFVEAILPDYKVREKLLEQQQSLPDFS